MKRFITMCVLALIFIFSDTFSQWQPIGPTGNVKLLTKTSKYLIAGNYYLIRSTDNGSTWDYIKYDNSNLYCDNSISFGDTLINIYTQTNSASISYDGGETWQAKKVPFFITEDGALKFDTDLIVFDAIHHKFYISKDTARTWDSLSNSPKEYCSTVRLLKNYIYLFDYKYGKAIYYSKDTCKTWNVVPTFNYDNYILSDGENVYYSKRNDTIKSKTFKFSLDDGKTWEEYNWEKFANIKINNFYIKNGYLHIVTPVETYYTTNKGVNWIETNYEFQPLTENNRMKINDFELAATSAGFFKRKIGETNWNYLNTNVNFANCYYMIEYKNNLFAISWSGVFKSTDEGKNWKPVNNGIKLANVTGIYSFNNQLWITTGHYFGDSLEFLVYKSSDLGENWTLQTSNLPKSYVSSLESNGDTTYACTKTGLYFSIDSCKTWSSYSQTFNNMNVISFSKYNNLIYVNTDTDLFKSSNWGLTFQKFHYGKFGENYFRQYVKIDSNFFMTGIKGLYKSPDGDKIWKIKHEYSYESGEVGNLIHKFGKYLFNTTNSHVYYSTDNGENWTSIADCYYGPALAALNNSIFLSSDHGILKFDLPTEFNKIKLTSPENMATNIKKDSFLLWDNPGNAVNFELELSGTNDFKNLIISKFLSYRYFDFDSLSPATKYYWRVRAVFGDVKGEWSDVWNFTTQGINGVETNDTDAVNIYPNPVSDKLLVILNSDNAERIVKLVDNLGQTLFSQNTTANNLNIDVSKFYSGSYFVVVESGEKRIVKKIEVTR